MADEINTSKPNVGIRGNPQSLPVYQSKETLSGASSTPSFVASFSNLATTPTALGTLSTQLLTNASNNLMDRWGYELGSNPHGNVLPAITKADTHFANAYANQAQATLGLHANKLLLEGQLQLEKAYKLTPDMIQSYTSNMAQGLDDILSQAPDAVKTTLHNEFGNSLLRSSYQLNNKMISQQKSDYKDQSEAYTKTQTQNIYETAMQGNSKEAKELLDSQIARNEQLKNSGVISATQAQTNNETARQTYLTGLHTQQAMVAKQNGKLPEYLASLNKKPEGVSYLDWESTTKGVLTNISQMEAIERRDQTLNASQFDLAIVENRVTSAVIEELREKQTPENFTQSMVKYATHLNKQANSQKSVNDLAANWASPIAQADATTKDQNATFQALSTAYQQRQINMGKTPVSDIEAKTIVAKNAGSPIPQFTDELNNMLISANPNLMVQASSAYRVLGGLKAPISSQAKAMMFGFDSQIQQGRTPEEAAEIVRNNIAPKTPDELAAQDMMWNQYKKDHMPTFDDSVRHAKNLMDIPYFSDVPNLSALTIQVNKAFESNLRLLNGDVNAAKSMTKSNLEQSYGVTYVNGHKEYTYLPIENFIGVQSGAAGIIQNDMAHQAMEQVKATKQAFDTGHNDFYYRIQDMPSLEKTIEAKKELTDIQNKHYAKGEFGPANLEITNILSPSYLERNQRMHELNEQIDTYESGRPVVVEKVWRDGHIQKFELSMQAGSNMGLGINSTTPIVGGYDISLRTPGGKLQPLIGVDNLANGNMVYKPNLEKLRTQYFELNGFSNPALEFEKQKVRAVEKAKFEEEHGIKKGISKYGRRFQ